MVKDSSSGVGGGNPVARQAGRIGAPTRGTSRQAMTRQGAHCRSVDVSMLLAMANYQLHQLEEGRAALRRGLEIADKKLPKLEISDLGECWDEWVFAHVLTREARALIDGA